MNKKLLMVLIGIVALALIGYGAYNYMSYHYGVKDYATSKADFTLTSDALKQEFIANETASTQKYQNKTVEVTGSVTENTGAAVNMNGVSCKMTAPATELKVGDNVKVKGRLVGYDSLLEEVQLDQCTVIK